MTGRRLGRSWPRQCAVAGEGQLFAPAEPAVETYSAFAEIYDFLVERPASSLVKAAFLNSIREFELEFRSIADIGCGTGRFLAGFAGSPIDLVGVDRSPSVLAVARRRLAGRPLRLLRQDIRRLSLPYPVDLITCNNQTVNYLIATADLARVFRAVAHALRRGGTFLFDFIARSLRASGVGRRRFRETIGLPDRRVNFEATVDPARGVSVVRIRIDGGAAPGGSLEVHRQKWYRPATIKRLLSASGFRLLDMRPMDRLNHAWLHVVARRV